MPKFSLDLRYLSICWTLSFIHVLDMLVSLTDSSMSTPHVYDNPQSPLDEFSGQESNKVPTIDYKQPTESWLFGTQFQKYSWIFPKTISASFLFCLSATAGFFACGLSECLWMPVWPLPVCDSWHMAPLYIHQPESTLPSVPAQWPLRPLPSWLCTRKTS